MHSNSLFTETVSNSPQTVTDTDLNIQSTTANLNGTKNVPNLSSARSEKEVSESESKRKGRGISHFGKPEIAFGTRISPGNDTRRLSTPDIKQGIILNSRFGRSDTARDDNQKSVGRTDDQEIDTDSRESSAFTRYADEDTVKDKEDIHLDQ